MITAVGYLIALTVWVVWAIFGVLGFMFTLQFSKAPDDIALKNNEWELDLEQKTVVIVSSFVLGPLMFIAGGIFLYVQSKQMKEV